jgi:glucose/arabinose dehydrogenase
MMEPGPLAVHRRHPLIAPLLAAAALAGGVSAAPGWHADVYARGLDRPTAFAWGPGRVLYATQERGAVVAVKPRRVVAAGFSTPLGLAWIGRTLFVSSQGRLDRMQVGARTTWGRRPVVSGLPYGRHQQDNVVVGRDGRLWLGSGSTCDLCRERDARSAAILSVRPDGGGLRVEARGLRNPYGLVSTPRGIFATVNNQDLLGEWEPAETVVRVRRGARYGWPACWPSWRQRALRGSCSGVDRPFAYLEPHSSADGIAYRAGALYVALWGQYASRAHGRYVVRVDLATRRVTTIARGFKHPLAVAVDARGGVLVGDWETGVVYRLSRLARRPASGRPPAG